MTIHWKAVQQYFAVELFVFQFQFINFLVGAVRSERVKIIKELGVTLGIWQHGKPSNLSIFTVNRR